MVIKSLAQTLKDLATGIKNTITGITSSNATLTIIKGNGTTSTVTVNNVANAGAATKATQDSAGQQINSTYIKGLSVSGQTITYTKGNNTTGTITKQDTAYTHPNSGVTAGTYKSVTVNAQGHITAGSNPTTIAEYGITDASLKGHTHDDRYYTESEIDSKVNTINASLNNKSDTTHTHSQYLTASSDLNVNKLKGVISLDNLPAGALERLVKVINDTARFALTTNDIQLGDTVKVESTKMMYIVKDITKLNSEDGYEQYTAGMASSVPWSGVTGKPSSYTPSAHTHDDRYYTESEINNKVNTINSSIDTKSDKTHTHDDRYYTESEMNTKLAGKSDTTHTHDNRYYTESEINSKVNTINTSINNKSDKTHTHDDRYYTESEINTKLSGKSDTSHTHNYLPLAGGTTTGKVNMKSANLDNLPQIFRTDGVNFAGIRFQNTNGYLGAIGITGNVNSVAQRLGSDGNLYPILDSSNYNNYSPTKTGGGASGTWGINISGKANTAGTADTSKACSGNSATATKATQDSSGQQINTTYIKGLSVSGKTITYTKGNGSTGTITTQDTAYSHPNSGVSAGTYRSVTVNAQGHVTSGSNPTTIAGYGITDAPTKTGGGASGTWGINISGNAASATTANTAKIISGFAYIDDGTWGHSTGTYITGFREIGGGSIQWRAEDGRLYERIDGTFWQREGTYEVIDTSTVNNYAPTKTGGGASGTWGINITGNATSATTANTATNASHATNADKATTATTATNATHASSADSATNADKVDGYHENSFLRYRGAAAATGEDTLWSQIGIKEYDGKLPKGVSGTYNYGAVVSLPGGSTRLDIWYNHQCSANKDGLWYRSGWGSDQKPWARLFDSNNYTNFVPTKTGTGASGTWGINISGNSATATKATQDSAGQQINTTYIKGLSVSGKTITYTKGNGTTGTITTQDTVYTLPAASSSTLGGIKMSYGTNDLSAGSSSLATGALYFVYE